jgi:ribosomal protein S14
MLSAKIKNIKARKNFEKVEKLKKIDEFLFINLLNKTNNSVEHSKVFSFFLKKKNKYSKTKITNRCVFNNRSRGVLRPYGISRTLLRELMQFGVFPGYSKAVW